MYERLTANIEHVLCALLLIGRLGDVISTRLGTPTLRLESNPIARRFGWGFIVATIGFCVVPYFSIELGIIITVMSLWVSADNIGRVWLLRSIGEPEYAEFVQRAVDRGTLSTALLMVFAKALFILAMGLLLCLLSYRFEPAWTYWFGIGIIAYGLTNLWMGAAHFVRLFHTAAEARTQPGSHPSQ